MVYICSMKKLITFLTILGSSTTMFSQILTVDVYNNQVSLEDFNRCDTIMVDYNLYSDYGLPERNITKKEVMGYFDITYNGEYGLDFIIPRKKEYKDKTFILFSTYEGGSRVINK